MAGRPKDKTGRDFSTHSRNWLAFLLERAELNQSDAERLGDVQRDLSDQQAMFGEEEAGRLVREWLELMIAEKE